MQNFMVGQNVSVGFATLRVRMYVCIYVCVYIYIYVCVGRVAQSV